MKGVYDGYIRRNRMDSCVICEHACLCVLPLAFMVFVIALLIKIHKTVSSLQDKIEKLKQAQIE